MQGRFADSTTLTACHLFEFDCIRVLVSAALACFIRTYTTENKKSAIEMLRLWVNNKQGNHSPTVYRLAGRLCGTLNVLSIILHLGRRTEMHWTSCGY